MNIYEKMVEIRKEVKYLQKSKQGAGYKYVSSSDTLTPIRKKMDELRVVLVPSVTHIDLHDHTTKSGGHQYFTVLTMQFTWVNAEDPKDKISCNWVGQGLDPGEKGVGKALTYAEKYFMLKFFNIPTDLDDPDAYRAKSEPAETISEKQVEEIENAMTVAGVALSDFLSRGNVNSIDQLPVSVYPGAIKWLQDLAGVNHVQN